MFIEVFDSVGDLVGRYVGVHLGMAASVRDFVDVAFIEHANFDPPIVEVRVYEGRDPGRGVVAHDCVLRSCWKKVDGRVVFFTRAEPGAAGPGDGHLSSP